MKASTARQIFTMENHCSEVYNSMRRDFTTLERYHGENLFIFHREYFEVNVVVHVKVNLPGILDVFHWPAQRLAS